MNFSCNNDEIEQRKSNNSLSKGNFIPYVGLLKQQKHSGILKTKKPKNRNSWYFRNQ